MRKYAGEQPLATSESIQIDLPEGGKRARTESGSVSKKKHFGQANLERGARKIETGYGSTDTENIRVSPD